MIYKQYTMYSNFFFHLHLHFKIQNVKCYYNIKILKNIAHLKMSLKVYIPSFLYSNALIVPVTHP